MTPDTNTDKVILRSLARHLRKHDVPCFDYDTDDQERAQELIAWFADSVDVLNVPERAAAAPTDGSTE